MAKSEVPGYLTLPSIYERWLTNQGDESTQDAYETDIDAKTESIGSPPYRMPSLQPSEILSLQMDHESQYEDEYISDEMRKLISQDAYSLSEEPGDIGNKKRREAAIALKAKIDERNKEWEYFHPLYVLDVTIRSIPDSHRFISYRTRREIEEKDRLQCCGSTVINEDDTEHPERYLPRILEKYLLHSGSGKVTSEMQVERLVGSLFLGVVVGGEERVIDKQ